MTSNFKDVFDLIKDALSNITAYAAVDMLTSWLLGIGAFFLVCFLFRDYYSFMRKFSKDKDGEFKCLDSVLRLQLRCISPNEINEKFMNKFKCSPVFRFKSFIRNLLKEEITYGTMDGNKYVIVTALFLSGLAVYGITLICNYPMRIETHCNNAAAIYEESKNILSEDELKLIKLRVQQIYGSYCNFDQ